MSFAFNFGHERSSEETDEDDARGSRGKRDADGDDHDNDAALRAAPRPRHNATRNGLHDSVIELSLPSSSGSADVVNGGDETALLNVCFEGDVTLRGVSSELACNELAAFGNRKGGGREATVADTAGAVAGAVAGAGAAGAASSGTGDGAAAPTASTGGCVDPATPSEVDDDDDDDNDDDDDPPAVAAAAQGSDLIPRVYEGGMKVWEGAGDLVNYMVRSSIPREGATVLELGAGAGFPGIYAAVSGASRVDFQDYNREVIELVTMPNYVLNVSAARTATTEGVSANDNSTLHEAPADAAAAAATDNSDEKSHEKTTARSVPFSPPRFFAGSWAALENHLSSGANTTYDLVLTAETLYSLDSMPELYSLLKATVAYPHGIALVASKTYYFGVGGGTRDFCAMVERDGHFTARTVFQSTGGVRREIIELRPIPKD